MQEAHDSYNASMVWEIANGSPSERDAGVARVASWVRAWNGMRRFTLGRHVQRYVLT